MTQQRLADRAAAIRRTHEEVLQVQSWFSEKGRKIVKEQGKARRLAAQSCDDRLGVRPRPEHRPVYRRPGSAALVPQFLVVGELIDQGENQRYIRGFRG